MKKLIRAGIAALLDIAQGDELQTRHGGFRILLICPPPVLEQGPRVGVSGLGGTAEYPWRFWVPGEPTVSRYRPGKPPRDRKVDA